LKPNINNNYRGGFTLLEVMMVMVIISTMSVALFTSLRTPTASPTARHRVTSVVEGDIRRAQGMALAGARFDDNVVCGYGITYIDQNAYLIFAEAMPEGGCSAGSRKYQPRIDFAVETIFLTNIKMQISEPFDDIFFEPPDPRTYINGQYDLNPPNNEGDIKISYIDQPCSIDTCTTIKVFTSGKVEIDN